MPKQKPRANRKKRLQRRAKSTARLALKIARSLKSFALKHHRGGASPDYYTVRVGRMPVKLKKFNGQRAWITDVKRVRFRITPNAKYRAMIASLMRMAEGVTVDLSAARRTATEEGSPPRGGDG